MANLKVKRAPSGQFVKGQSGNPGGRPPVAGNLRAAFAQFTPAAVETLFGLLQSQDDNIRLKAALAIIDRGLGKPKEMAFTLAGEELQTRPPLGPGLVGLDDVLGY